MLDQFAILSKGGFVLWQKTFIPVMGSPIDTLIKDVLIEERAGTNIFYKDSYALKWTFANEVDLVFVVAFQKILQLPYVDELLETVKQLFIKTFEQDIKSNNGIEGDYASFDEMFNKLLRQLEEKHASNRQRAPRKFEQTKKYENTLKGSQEANSPSNKSRSANSVTPAGLDQDEITKNIQALKLQSSPRTGPRAKKGRQNNNSPKSPNMNNDESLKKKKSQKQARVWEGQIARGEMESLDYSSKAALTSEEEAAVAAQLADPTKYGTVNKDGVYEVMDVDQGGDSDLDEEDEEEYDILKQNEKTESEGGSGGGMFSFFKNMTGQRELTADTLDPVLSDMKEHLIKKNVASDIAEHLCQSVRTSLLGKKIGSWGRVSTMVRDSMEAALKRILTPKTSLDILRDVEQAKAERRPYVISFIGVNGVGKSTNLSKVCFWLLQNNYKVLIAACDTFRSGAVEQLRVHARNLRALQTSGQGSVELFERGYGKDSAGIAKEAISFATSNHFDVVLIDTAGRMQDNEPLMRALAKLVAVNNPDKIIFVGEALVGNEAVDQLTKFNQSLKDFSGLQNPRNIDGMILTKFDTIDDKVGAALSMTYITGQPIYFVGTGQTYTDLKNLRVSHVVNSLLRK
ncbi:signal recognition particle, alpha subunit, N-terminal-domain-containing protein [Phascolomyces articulosus]|uniref:Signal recognition particle, alpha subunit, N-terminal-domain-containing protein n=1 Tax=Phascolomyces articulosus TaxID=60185 RepID=A0AAD5KBQ6_9FUNG|nr:signal recognition particle, alpha subunit, N-terminal-domain-containing protein [Phascolomyces articulosus]